MASKIHVEQRYACSAQALFDLLIDDAFDAALLAASGVKREVVELEERAQGPRMRLKMTPTTSLPGFMKKAIKVEHYFQVRDWNRERLSYDWTIEMGFGGDNLDIAGTLDVIAEPDGTCRRVIDGHVSVRITLIGSKIEQFIVKQTSESFVRGEAFINDRLAALT